MNAIFNKFQQVKKLITPSGVMENILFPTNVKKFLISAKNEDAISTLMKAEDSTASEYMKPPSLLQRTGERLLHEELQKQTNLEKILGKTESIVMNDVKNSADESQSLDQDWLMYYSENACKVSNEQMQNFWAKLLSGEIANPGTFSKRTIDVLLKLSSREATLFKKICGYFLEAVYSNFLISNRDFEQFTDLSYTNIMRLSECGILVASGMNRMKLSADENKDIDIISNDILIKGKSTEKISVEWQVFPLTVAGTELMKITYQNTPKIYLQSLVKYLKKEYSNISWSAYKITDRDKESLYYEDEDIIAVIESPNFESL